MIEAQIPAGKYIAEWNHQNNSPAGKRITQCYIKSEGRKIGEGIAVCSKVDNYDRSKGRKISLARALKDGCFGKKERGIFWNEYLKNIRV